MKTYKVTASFSTYCQVFIEAESLEEAIELAHEMDGLTFRPDGQDFWQIEDVEEQTK
jgi:hypothetical protein